MTTIKCFLLEPTDRAVESLRRFAGLSAGPCSGPLGYHDVSVRVGEVPLALDATSGLCGSGALYRDDPRWPALCACGYAFADGDLKECNTDRLYRRSDTGDLTTLRDAPVGAMWFAPWYEFWKGPDGRCLVVKTPGGDWSPDQPSTDGTPWQRSGTPPLVTASPSIGMHNRDGSWRYHGWLRNGELVDA